MKARKTSTWILVASLIALAGCHKKLKEFARTADVVEVSVAVPGRPYVDLDNSGNSSNVTDTNIEALGEIAVGTAATISSIKVRERVERLITPQVVQSSIQQSVAADLQSGWPFAAGSRQDRDGFMELMLTNYGIVQSGGGPVFFADYTVRIYRSGDNKRVYRNHVSCHDREFYVPPTLANAAGTIATIHYLNSLSDEELVRRVEAAVERCSRVVITELRRHAG